MLEIIEKIQNLNSDMRNTLSSPSFDADFEKLSSSDKEKLSQALFVSIQNVKILSNKLK